MLTHRVLSSRTVAPASVRFGSVALLAFLLATNGFAQVRPTPPGGGGGGGGIGINPPIVIPPGGGGGGGGGGVVTPTPTIVAPRGILAGDTVNATVALNLGGGALNPAARNATYQWSITGGRIVSDTRAAIVQFVADRAGPVTLAVTVGVDGTSYSPTAEITAVSTETAGTVTAPARAAASTTETLTASVPAGQNGDRTFRWTVSGDAVIVSGQTASTVTFRPGSAGTKVLTCNVNLQNLVNIPVRAYVVVTGTGAPAALTIANGSGGGTYPAGSRVDIFADTPPAGQVFDRWTGNTEILGTGALAPLLARTVITVPAGGATLTATYKPAPAWTPTTVTAFNPQTQTGANNTTITVSTTLRYHIPANATGLVFLLHDGEGSAADWFNRPEQLLLARDLVAAGYGVAALDSVNRTAGNWSAQVVLANNLDAQNHAAALDRFVRDNALGATRPVFFLGLGNGSGPAVRYADLLATATPARPVRGAVLYLGTGNETLAITSRVPTFYALAANDDTLGAAALQTARGNSQLQVGRGIPSAFYTNPVAPVHPGRFRTLGLTGGTFTATDAQAVHTAVKSAGLLDENNYPKTVPTVAALAPVLPEPHRARAADIAAQLAIAAAEREFFGDANARVLGFLAARTANAPAPPPGRLVNLSTRSRIAFVGDTFALGFNISGTERAALLIRGIGPTLRAFGVTDALAAPRLTVNRGTTVIASNEGWDKGTAANTALLASAAATVGAFQLSSGSADTAVHLQLDPGTYTVTIEALGGTTGEVLAEIYDVSRNGTRLTNLSTLAKISTEGELLIPGIVVAGNNPRTLLVRAVAQGLRDFGLGADAVLGDPRITILEGTQTVAANNNWAQAGAATLNAAFPAVGAFPLRTANDAALVESLAPGSYTLQAGAAPVATPPAGQEPPPTTVTPNPTGAVLVEVYEVP